MSYQKRRYNRLVRQVLYGLKRQYGDTIAAYKLLDADTDYTTGIKTIQKTNHILTAIVIPSVISREVLQSISQISANKAMVYGGSFDPDQKTFIIDSRSLPQGWIFSNDDWLVYNDRRFEMKNIIQLDFQAGWIITGKAVIGQHAEQIFHLNTGSRLSLTQEAVTLG